MRTTCPQCQNSAKITEEHLKKLVRCKKCGNQFRASCDPLDELDAVEPFPSANAALAASASQLQEKRYYARENGIAPFHGPFTLAELKREIELGRLASRCEILEAAGRSERTLRQSAATEQKRPSVFRMRMPMENLFHAHRAILIFGVVLFGLLILGIANWRRIEGNRKEVRAISEGNSRAEDQKQLGEVKQQIGLLEIERRKLADERQRLQQENDRREGQRLEAESQKAFLRGERERLERERTMQIEAKREASKVAASALSEYIKSNDGTACANALNCFKIYGRLYVNKDWDRRTAKLELVEEIAEAALLAAKNGSQFDSSVQSKIIREIASDSVAGHLLLNPRDPPEQWKTLGDMWRELPSK